MKDFNIKETLAAIGVIISLIFVGIEISQNTAASRGQTRTELAALNQEWLFLMSDPDYNGFFARAWSEDSIGELDRDELARGAVLMIANLRRLENVYFQYREGLVDESALDSYGFRAFGILYSGKAFEDWWFNGTTRATFHPDFIKLFEQVQGISDPKLN